MDATKSATAQIQPVAHALQRKRALALARPFDNAGSYHADCNAAFELSQTIFKTLPPGVKTLFQRTKLDTVLQWKPAAAAAIEEAYLRAGPAPSLADDANLHRFMLTECDFSTEHADGSFLDHLHFCREYTARHYPGVSPRIMLLHSIMGVGTNCFPMTIDKLPALKSLLVPMQRLQPEAGGGCAYLNLTGGGCACLNLTGGGCCAYLNLTGGGCCACLNLTGGSCCACLNLAGGGCCACLNVAGGGYAAHCFLCLRPTGWWHRLQTRSHTSRPSRPSCASSFTALSSQVPTPPLQPWAWPMVAVLTGCCAHWNLCSPVAMLTGCYTHWLLCSLAPCVRALHTPRPSLAELSACDDDALSRLEGVRLRRLLDNASIHLTSSQLWVQLNLQMIHAIDFLPVGGWQVRHLPRSPHLSPHLPHLPTPPHTFPYLPTPSHTFPYLPKPSPTPSHTSPHRLTPSHAIGLSPAAHEQRVLFRPLHLSARAAHTRGPARR